MQQNNGGAGHRQKSDGHSSHRAVHGSRGTTHTAVESVASSGQQRVWQAQGTAERRAEAGTHRAV
eukprot:2321368-Prymnesium_polylepis.1